MYELHWKFLMDVSMLLTCIGPASKEMSRHYWREPLVLEALHDPEVDLCGVIFVGSPQINAEKFYVSERLGQTVEMMDVDGAFVTTEGFRKQPYRLC